MESDYKEKYDAIANDVQEIKTTNRFALRRLHQLLDFDGGKCPVCGCECATDGYSEAMRELELNVKDLENIHTEREAQLSRVLKQFRGVQKRLQCMISDLPETLQEVLGTLFNILEPFLNNGTHDELVDSRESSMIDGYSDERSLNSADLRSENSESEEESSIINDFEEEIKDTSITSFKTGQTADSISESENFNKVKQDLLSVVVNTVQEMKHPVQSLKPETEQLTNRESPRYKEISTQTVDPSVQSSMYLSVTDGKPGQQSNPKAATAATQKHPSSSRLDLSAHADEPKSPCASKLPEVVYQREKKEVLDITWHMLGSEELSKAKRLGLHDITGARTVLCLDISASMTEYDAWSQAKHFFDSFIGGVENMNVENEGVVEENIALCTFGHNTGISQRLTKELSDIRKAFKSIKLGGPSPMYGGLMLAVAALAIPEVNHVKQLQ